MPIQMKMQRGDEREREGKIGVSHKLMQGGDIERAKMSHTKCREGRQGEREMASTMGYVLQRCQEEKREKERYWLCLTHRDDRKRRHKEKRKTTSTVSHTNRRGWKGGRQIYFPSECRSDMTSEFLKHTHTHTNTKLWEWERDHFVQELSWWRERERERDHLITSCWFPFQQNTIKIGTVPR